MSPEQTLVTLCPASSWQTRATVFSAFFLAFIARGRSCPLNRTVFVFFSTGCSEASHSRFPCHPPPNIHSATLQKHPGSLISVNLILRLQMKCFAVLTQQRAVQHWRACQRFEVMDTAGLVISQKRKWLSVEYECLRGSSAYWENPVGMTVRRMVCGQSIRYIMVHVMLYSQQRVQITMIYRQGHTLSSK